MVATLMRPALLDLFCGAGGAAMGYHRAGFEIVGVDIKPQPRYPFRFVRYDALEYLRGMIRDPEAGWEVQAIHASPPCQRYSRYVRNIGTTDRHPDLLPDVRILLDGVGLPYVIENVPGAPMRPDIILCGSMFGLPIVRHRWFEFSSPTLSLVQPCAHVDAPIGVYGHGTPQWHRERLGRNTTKQDWCDAMGIDWMTRAELAEAIPPAYTEHIGTHLLEHLKAAA